MGYSITEKNGKWQATKNGKWQASSISGEKLLSKAGTKEDIKKCFIENAIWDMFEKIIEIEMDFPLHYTVNGKLCFEPRPTFNEWYLALEDNGEMYLKVNEIIKKYNLEKYFVSCVD